MVRQSERSVEQCRALEACLQNVLEIHGGAEGFVHVWQRQSSDSHLRVLARLTDFVEKFRAADWEFRGNYPYELHHRQHTYRIPWWRAGAFSYPPVRQLRCIVVDLDCHQLPDPALPIDAVAGALNAVAGCGLPRPNHVDYSGDGVNGGAYLRWLIEPVGTATQPVQRHERELWIAVSRRLVETLAEYGADPHIAELSHWLRVPGSINSKYLTGAQFRPSFREARHQQRTTLAHIAAALGIAEIPPYQNMTGQVRTSPAQPANTHQGEADKPKARHPHQHIADALVRLNRLRGGMQKGDRNVALYIYSLLLSGATISHERKLETASSLNVGFHPPLSTQEAEATIASGLSGKPGKFSYRWLIKKFRITTEEQSKIEIQPRPPIRNSRGSVIEENKDWYKEDTRQRVERHRRNKGVRTRAQANKEIAAARSQKTRDRLLAIRATLPSEQRNNIAALHRASGISRQTIRRHLKQQGSTSTHSKGR